MTGSPHILKDYNFPNGTNRLNMQDKCINTMPKQVVFVTKEQAKTILSGILANGERAAYYFNHRCMCLPQKGLDIFVFDVDALLVLARRQEELYFLQQALMHYDVLFCCNHSVIQAGFVGF